VPQHLEVQKPKTKVKNCLFQMLQIKYIVVPFKKTVISRGGAAVH